jgi:hypothetical protein
VADRVGILHKRENLTHNKYTQRKTNTAKSIRAKLEENNATIACADKGNSMVILPTEQYEGKIQNLIDANKFHKTTKTFENQVLKIIKQANISSPQTPHGNIKT